MVMKRKTALHFFLLCLVSSRLFSFQLLPITANMTPTGPGSIRNFKIYNNTNEIIAVQVSMHTRSITPEGEEINGPADNLFIVYPARIILKQGEEQTVRIQWKGDPEPAAERPFRIIAEQLPVDFSGNENGTGGLKIMFRYLGSVYVGQRSMKPDVRVDSIERSGGMLFITLINSGKAHAILQDLNFILTDDSSLELFRYAGPNLTGMDGENILAGERRIFTLPEPPDLPEIDFDGYVTFKTP